MSRIQTLPVFLSAQTSACWRESTLESKKPLVWVGIVFALVWRPMRRVSE